MDQKKKRSSGIGNTTKVKRHPERREEILMLVQRGVEEFILGGAPIADFQKTVRRAVDDGEFSSHPLTRSAFVKIVREAIRQRKRNLAKRGMK
jgi:hypothetical protein